MIPIEGRLALGLDEFMLRFGHLAVLAHVACVIAPRSTRLEREFGKFITRSIEVPPDCNQSVAHYLAAKKLCTTTLQKPDEEHGRQAYRYPDLEVFDHTDTNKQNNYRVRSRANRSVDIWWQDFCLSKEEMESCVGGITIDAKSGSTTGSSHIINWATILGLLNRDLSPSIECYLLAHFQSEMFSAPHANPYYLSTNQRVILAYLLLKADLDVFARLAKEILVASAPIGKSDGAQLFGLAIQRLSDDLDHQRTAPHRVQFRVLEQIKELKRAQRTKKDAPLGSSSTAWHRASSRFESYVDLGLLKKRLGGDHGRYEYVYYPTKTLAAVSESIAHATTAQDWIEGVFMDTFGPTGGHAEGLKPLEVQKLLTPMLSALGRPIQLFPIDILAIGLCLKAPTIGSKLTIGAARRSLESFARLNPDMARLSRGSIGERAEYISISSTKIQHD